MVLLKPLVFYIQKQQAIPLPLFFIYKNDMVLLKPLFLFCKNDRAMLITFSADDTSNEKEVRNIKQKQQPKLKLSGKNHGKQTAIYCFLILKIDSHRI